MQSEVKVQRDKVTLKTSWLIAGWGRRHKKQGIQKSLGPFLVPERRQNAWLHNTYKTFQSWKLRFRKIQPVASDHRSSQWNRDLCYLNPSFFRLEYLLREQKQNPSNSRQEKVSEWDGCLLRASANDQANTSENHHV